MDWVDLAQMQEADGSYLIDQAVVIRQDPVAREAAAPGVQLKPPKPPPKTDRRPTTGLWTRTPDGAIDHAFLDGDGYPVCHKAHCQHDCCRDVDGNRGSLVALTDDARRTYVRNVREQCRAAYGTANKSRGVNLFLVGNITPIYKTEVGADGVTRHSFNTYRLPPTADGENPITVSRDYWMQIFCVGADKMTSLSKQKRSTAPVQEETRGGHGHIELQEAYETLDLVIKKHLLSSEDHYVGFQTKNNRQRVQTGITRVHLWKEACRMLNPDFHAQCKRLQYWPTMSVRERPVDAAYLADWEQQDQAFRDKYTLHRNEEGVKPCNVRSDGRLEQGARVEANFGGKHKWLKGTIERVNSNGTFNIRYDATPITMVPAPFSFAAARRHISKKLLRFKELSVDMCQRCLTLLLKLKDASVDEAEKRKLREEYEEHRVEERTSYAFRKHDHESRRNSDWHRKHCVVVDLDFAGKLRTPFVPNPEAYYLAVCSMDNLVFATEDEVHYFGFDERTAGKGANVVMSLLKKFIDLQIIKLKAQGGSLKHLIIWCDRYVARRLSPGHCHHRAASTITLTHTHARARSGARTRTRTHAHTRAHTLAARAARRGTPSPCASSPTCSCRGRRSTSRDSSALTSSAASWGIRAY
jgi:hypothetical protein